MTTEQMNVGTPLKNARRERFCLNLIHGMSQTEAARQAGYSVKMAKPFGSQLMTFLDVRMRLIELRNVLAAEHIMTVVERKERLSEIGRAKLRDYRRDPFADDVPNPGALSEVLYDVDEELTKVKLHDPVKAISELNKMERIYETGAQVNVQQNVVNIQVISNDAKSITEQIIDGEGTVE